MSLAAMIRKCLQTAFDANPAALGAAQLAPLLRLQHTLCCQRTLLAYLLDDHTGTLDTLPDKCRPAITQALKRLKADPADPQLLLPLLPIHTHFPQYADALETHFVAYIKSTLGEPLSPVQQSAFVAIYAHLRYLHVSHLTPDFVAGKAQAILDQWISSFDPHAGWTGLTLAESLLRLQCIDDYDVRRSLNIKKSRADAIYRHYLQDIRPYGDNDFCHAVALRSADIDNAEAAYAAADLERASALLDGAPDLATRLMAAHAIIEALQCLYADEAAAIAALPPSARARYAKAVSAANVPAIPDGALIKAAQLAFSVITTLYSLEDEYGFIVDNLKIAQVARQLCNELVARGDEKMLRLAKKIGFGDTKIGDMEQLWAIGADDAVQKIVAEALSIDDNKNRTDAELVGLAQLIKAIHDNRAKLNIDGDRLESAMQKCFAPLWFRYCQGEGNPLLQFRGIKAIFDCKSAGIGFYFYEHMMQIERTLVETLLQAKDEHLECGLFAVEVATSYPLRETESFDFSVRYKETIGMDFVRDEMYRWAKEIEAKGCWKGVSLDEAFRRIRIFQDDRLRSVDGIDYPWVIATAFNNYSKQVIEIDDASSDIQMHPCSVEAIGLMADCYFALDNPDTTDLLPAHLIRLCTSFPEALRGASRWLLYSILLRAHLLQSQLLSTVPHLSYALN